MVPIPNSGPVTSDAESEVEPAPCPSDAEEASDSEEEDFLSQLVETLAGPPAKKPRIASADEGTVVPPADWPLEVKLTVATFLPWRELPRAARISQGWHSLEQSQALWKEYFGIQWPRLFRRKAAIYSHGGVPWRALFRQRWAEPDRSEDAEQEHWNDFSAALDLWKSSGSPTRLPLESPEKMLSEELQIQHAVKRFKDDLLRLRGVCVPSFPVEPGTADHCTRLHGKCRHRTVPIAGKLDGCLFVCECCANVHICRPREPCEGSVLTGQNEFLVCTVSGRCFDPSRLCWAEETLECMGNKELEEAAVAEHNWDPGLSTSQQHARWFEQGYSMDEEQADDFFNESCDRKQRQRLRCRLQTTASASSRGLLEAACEETCQ